MDHQEAIMEMGKRVPKTTRILMRYFGLLTLMRSLMK